MLSFDLIWMKEIPNFFYKISINFKAANKKKYPQTGLERFPPFLQSIVKSAVKSRILSILYGPHLVGY
jgi:hypothetical protein